VEALARLPKCGFRVPGNRDSLLVVRLPNSCTGEVAVMHLCWFTGCALPKSIKAETWKAFQTVQTTGKLPPVGDAKPKKTHDAKQPAGATPAQTPAGVNP
jgi:hypothetical protein